VTGARRERPEVLAPAGAPECLPAAVAGGADAVYLGLRHFNARGRAENFRKADLPRHVDYLHRHGVKCYVVLNTLVHDDEYAKALELARSAHEAGVDAAIVQDLGLWTALGRELPGLERHASTQMTVHHPSQIAVLARLGAARVILARELTLAEIAECVATAAALGVEIEHFVHGALCYAFSGQCLMSNFAGCRSANRGTCAQNCRFDYLGAGISAPRDPRAKPGEEADTVISMRDLSLIERVGDLADAGVISLKIEGRLKGPEYVYTVSRVYREATEAWASKRRFDVRGARERLKDVFARANSDAPLAGEYAEAARLHRYDPAQDREPDAEVVSADRARGEVVVVSRAEVRAGQGYAFSVGFHNGGFLVTHADRGARPGTWRLRVRIEERGPRLPVGLALFRNADHERKREAARAMAEVPLPRPAEEGVALELRADGAIGEAMRVVGETSDGRRAEAASAQPLAAAAKTPLDDTSVRDSLGALGGSGFTLARLELALTGACFLPAAELKRMRRVLVEELSRQTPRAVVADPAPTEPAARARRRETRVWVAVGSLESARAALAAGACAVWLDDPALELWAERSPRLDTAGFAPRSLWLRHPAVAPLSPHLAAIGLPVVAGHLGALAAAHAAGLPAIADAACNVFSAATLRALAGLGAEAAVVSLECSSREIARIAARMADVEAPRIAVVAAGRLPAMLTRQDHGLAVGATAIIRAAPHDGGLPYELQRRHHDTVVWEGRRLCAPEHVVATAGLVDAWVLELADLAPTAAGEVVAAYTGLRDGRLDPAQARAAHERHAPHGVFTGHLHQGSRELDAVAAE
jgi:putative protease